MWFEIVIPFFDDKSFYLFSLAKHTWYRYMNAYIREVILNFASKCSPVTSNAEMFIALTSNTKANIDLNFIFVSYYLINEYILNIARRFLFFNNISEIISGSSHSIIKKFFLKHRFYFQRGLLSMLDTFLHPSLL